MEEKSVLKKILEKKRNHKAYEQKWTKKSEEI